MIEGSHHELLAHIAAMYYEQEMTQNDIAAQLELSRVKVYRLLKEAREKGVVQITVNWPVSRDAELERQLCRTFRLDESLVLRTDPHSHTSPLQCLGQLGARYLERVLTDGSTMAVCLGRTSYETIRAISPSFQARVRVAQAVGSMPFSMQELDGATLARLLAQKLGGEVLYLTSPLMADSPAAADIFRNQRDINHTLTVAKSADVALAGIGSLDPITSGFAKAGFISAEELMALTASGAAGDMAGQIYTLDGELFPCEYNQRVITITLDALRRIPITIAVAMGKEKAKAILGGLRTGVLNVLCTDDQAAREILILERN